jgi:hypothetical protein
MCTEDAIGDAANNCAKKDGIRRGLSIGYQNDGGFFGRNGAVVFSRKLSMDRQRWRNFVDYSSMPTIDCAWFFGLSAKRRPSDVYRFSPGTGRE